jgi:hypothetical protein
LPLRERLDNFEFNIDTAGDEKQKRKDKRNDERYLNIFILLGFDGFEHYKLQGAKVLTEIEQDVQHPALHFRLQNDQQHDTS